MKLNFRTPPIWLLLFFVPILFVVGYNMTGNRREHTPPAESVAVRDVIVICGREWSTKNLNVVTYRNGDAIPQVTNPKDWQTLKTGAWCWYNNDSATYAAKYGRLYNWFAVNDPRGLAPKGWHVPNYTEWSGLDSCVGGDSLGFRLRGQGWPVPASPADNTSGFTGLPGGMRSDDGTFQWIEQNAVFWASDEGSKSETWCYRLVHYVNSEKVPLMGTGWGYMSKHAGYSVRCVRDSLPNR